MNASLYLSAPDHTLFSGTLDLPSARGRALSVAAARRYALLEAVEGSPSSTDPARPKMATHVKSTLELNKQLATGWLDQVSHHDIDAMLATTAHDWRMHGGPPGLPAGKDGVQALFAQLGDIEQTWTVDDVVAERDRVVVRATNVCVQESTFGIPASGVTQVFTATFTFRIHRGKVAEVWRNADDLGRLLQLGMTFTPR